MMERGLDVCFERGGMKDMVEMFESVVDEVEWVRGM